MLYIRKLFTQDLRDGKQIAFPKEVSYSFFCFDYINKEEDRKIKFTFRANFGQFQEFEGKEITTRLYAAGSESRMDGEVKAFIRDELKAQVDDLLIIKSKGTKHIDFDVMFVPKSNNQYYPLLLKLSFSENHSVYSTEEQIQEDCIDKLPLQQIYYGAPGTGKSHIVKKQTEGESVVRTTFHPDSDYSTFVGCYKPTTKPCPMYTSYGEKAVTIKDATGKELTENRIVYEFVDQAFLQAYIKAWKFYAQATEGSDPKKQYLIIEEINRGNCAQIFGDLFQLLDRNGRGFSDYYIHADNDLKRHIYQKFQDNGVTFSEYHQKAIDAVYPKEEESVALRVLSGEILLLPNNLYIWATMNTSDQSLFPIDSAFKRRWDWKYRPIVKGRDEDGKELKWRIAADTKEYDWWSFLEKINAVIGSTTSSEDKKLGFFFCKAIDGVISAETFVSKIIFYLWNDVFKDFGFDEDIFKDEISTDGTYSTLDFDKFYTATANGETIVRKVKVEKFLENLKVEEATNVPDNAGREDEDGNIGSSRTRDYTKYSINGVGKYGKNPLASECVKEYVKLHPELSAEEVIANWKSLGNIVPHFIESEEEHNARTDNSVRSIKIECRGELIYVENNGYGNNGKVDILINAINQKDWGIKVGKIE